MVSWMIDVTCGPTIRANHEATQLLPNAGCLFLNPDHLVLGLLQTSCHVAELLAGQGVTYDLALAAADAKVRQLSQ